jgi:8-oxo-dGTP diphosphatase
MVFLVFAQKTALSHKNSLNWQTGDGLITKRRRGTAIVETAEGILVVSHDNRTFYLPGGGAEEGESRREAAMRELFEETGLVTTDCSFLFEYPSFTNNHKVFLMETTGTAEPGNEIRYVDYFDGSNLKVSSTTWEIIELYHMKQKISAGHVLTAQQKKEPTPT